MAHGTVLKIVWESVNKSEYDLLIKDGAGAVVARGRYSSNRNPSDLERERDLVIESVSRFYAELLEWVD